MIDEFGGIDGVADGGLLESAVSSPAAGFGDSDVYKTIPEKAAVLLYSLCKNHPFLDGNKRVAAASCEVFLLLNGFELSIDNDRFGDIVIAVADSSLDRETLISEFSTYATPCP